MMLRVLALLSVISLVSGGRCKYRESRVREQVIAVPRNCRVKLSQVGEEYWTSVGYDGLLRNGRTTADFLTLPQSGEGKIRQGWVAYWITKDRYGPGQHYEVFGHAYLRSDGRVCALFAGKERDVIELCGGFRVLSRSRNNPSEEMPFEWIQAGYARPRETLGFHHHRIAKYEWTPEDVFYGDAHLRTRTFHGVSPDSRFFMEMSTPELFARKVWVLRRKPEAVAALEAQGAGYIPDRSYQDPRYSPSYRRPLSSTDDVTAQARPSQRQGSSIGSGVGVETPGHWQQDSRHVQVHPAQPSVHHQTPSPSREAHPAQPLSSVQGSDHLRFRYVKKEDVIKDQYGNLYVGRNEDGQTHYYPYKQAEDRRDVVPERVEPGAVDALTPVVHGHQDVSQPSRPVAASAYHDYEAERRAHHEEYLRQQEHRRQEAARRRQEDEARRAELMASRETTRDSYRPTASGALSENSITNEDLNGSAEVSQFTPERLPLPRALLPEERENFDV
ncbi:hypothetical protein Q1695_009242 [Nippostrongylus brasiliensis]|nr:hypothetical protein Q1695_009242 [Nippostrongylus brasiliensis]